MTEDRVPYGLERDPRESRCNLCAFNHGSRSVTAAGFCILRSQDLPDPGATQCANHPFFNLRGLKIPIGPIYTVEDASRRPWKPSPDTEAVRTGLLRLLDEEISPASALPDPAVLECEVIRQLGFLREKRAAAGLRRLVNFRPMPNAGPDAGKAAPCRSRWPVLEAALEALSRIEGAQALEDLRPFLTLGLDPARDKPLEIYERRSGLRSAAVRALRHCGREAKPLLELAAKDPVRSVAEGASRLLAILGS